MLSSKEGSQSALLKILAIQWNELCRRMGYESAYDSGRVSYIQLRKNEITPNGNSGHWK